jgi:4-azaleucine resistance transporter AzlC
MSDFELRRSGFIQGSLQAGAIVLGYLPIGFTFGLLAQKAGITVFNALLMSLLVYAGSSQLIAVGLFAAGAPSLSIILTTFIVNIRHLLMSAAVAPYLKRWRKVEIMAFAYQLTDETFALHSERFSTGFPKKAEVFGVNMTAQAAWIVGTWAGILFGRLIVDVRPLALDYALPAMFIALLVLQIKDSIQVAVSVVSGLIAIALTLNGASRWYVVVATLLSASLGMGIEIWTKQRFS